MLIFTVLRPFLRPIWVYFDEQRRHRISAASIRTSNKWTAASAAPLRFLSGTSGTPAGTWGRMGPCPWTYAVVKKHVFDAVCAV